MEHETGAAPPAQAKAAEPGREGADAHDDWDAPVRTDPLATLADEDRDGRLVVDIAGYEGPLDVLLALARTQKLDLKNISILALVEQYLTFIAEARRLELEVAADYLVMAAWLAFLKSRLLLPRDDEPEDLLPAEEMARRLAFRLMRLEAMRNHAARLMARPRLGRDVFARGRPEAVEVKTTVRYAADLVDLLRAYARQRQRVVSARTIHRVVRRRVWSIKEARQRLESLLGMPLSDWMSLDSYLEQYLATPEEVRTARAASFGASLEMAREGHVELRQTEPFAPLYMRRRTEPSHRPAAEAESPAGPAETSKEDTNP